MSPSPTLAKYVQYVSHLPILDLVELFMSMLRSAFTDFSRCRASVPFSNMHTMQLKIKGTKFSGET